MKQLRSKKRSQQWIAVLLAVVMVVGHMAMASAYDPNAGGDGYVNAPLLDLTNGGSGAGVNDIGDGSGTGGNGVQAGSSDGAFTFDPYANTITGNNGEGITPQGEGEGGEEEITLDPETFGEGGVEPQPGDEYIITFNINNVSGVGNEQRYDITFFITSRTNAAIPEDTEIIAEFPAFVTAKSLEDAAAALMTVSRGKVIKSFTVTGGEGERKVLTMITNEVTTDKPWQIGLELSLYVDKLYSHSDNTVKVSVGNTIGGGVIIIDDGTGEWGDKSVEVQKQLLNSTIMNGRPVIDNEKGIAKYQVDIKLPPLTASFNGGEKILATIEDTFTNERYALSDVNGENFATRGSQQEADLIASLEAQVMAGLNAAGWREDYSEKMVLVELKYGNDGYARGFKISIFGITSEDVDVMLRLSYFAAPTRPLKLGENEFVTNNVIVVYGESNDEDIIEVLANRTYASLWRKQVGGGTSILIEEKLNDGGPKPTKQEVEFEFVITVLGGGMGYIGETLLDDYLADEFTYLSSANESGTIDQFNTMKNETDPYVPSNDVHFGVYVSADNKHVKIGHNKSGYINSGVYSVKFKAEMDLTKIKPGQSGVNKVGNDVVYIYRNAVLSVGKEWETPPLGQTGVKSDIRFELYKGGVLVESQTLSEQDIESGKRAEFKFWYNMPGLQNGVNVYTIREVLVNEADSTYATIADKTVRVEKYTDDLNYKRGVRFVDANGNVIDEASPGEHEETFLNPFDDSRGEIMFHKVSTRANYADMLVDGAEFKLEMAKGTFDGSGKLTGVSDDRLAVQLKKFDPASDQLHDDPDAHNGARGEVYEYVNTGGTATTISTDGGYATIIHLPYVSGEYNVYVLTEVAPPDGHDFGNTRELYFQLGKNNKQDFKATNVFKNPIFDEGKISILKVDDAAPTPKPLSGARFTITRGTFEGGTFTPEMSNGGYTFQRTSAYTDVDPIKGNGGKVTFDGLTNGVYEIKEIGAPFGYRRFDGAVYVKISQKEGQQTAEILETIGSAWDSATIIDGTNIALTWVNETLYGWIEFTKVKAEDKSPLAGATFGLYRTNDKFEEPVEYMIGEGAEAKHYQITTDGTGAVKFGPLRYGYYIVRELSTDSEYFIGLPEVRFIVNDEAAAASGTSDLGAAGDYKWPNPKRGRIEFYKVDWDNTSTTLAGAEFELFKLVDGKFEAYPDAASQMTDTSDANGRIAFEGLEYGTYRVVETKAPNGDYYVDPDNQPFVDFDVGATTNPDQTKTYTHYVYNGTRYNWLNPKLGSIAFKKVDSQGAPLANAQFRLDKRDGSNWVPHENMTATTTGTGLVNFDKLPHGRYRVVETTPPSGYFGKVTEVVFVVGRTTTMEPGDALEVISGVTLWRNLKKGGIEFYKVDSRDNGKGLANAEFSLYKVIKNGSGVETGREKIAEGVKSGADGKVSFTGLDHGTYVVVETKAPSGFMLAAPLPEVYFTVTETFDTTTGGNTIITKGSNGWLWPNPPLKGTINVFKYDISDPENPDSMLTPLQDVNFQLYMLTNAQTGATTTIGGPASTNAQGQVTFSGTDGKGLEAGTYYIVETSVPAGYEKSPEYATLTAAKNHPIVLGPETTDVWLRNVDVFNPRILKTVTFIKGDEGTSGVLAGAKFTLKGNSAMNGVTYEAEATSGVDGKVTFVNVPFGTYTLTETLPPTGYAPITPRTNIVVNASTPDTYDLGRINDYPYELVVTKSDIETTGAATVYLPGAEFQIYVKDGGATKYVKATTATSPSGVNAYEYVGLVDKADATTFVTGSDGKLTIKKMAYLPGNKYLIKETKAPENYVLVDKEFEVEFNENSSTAVVQKTVDVPNGAVYGSIEITKIDGSTKGALEGVVFELKRQGAADGSAIELVTDQYGKAKAENLIYGTYELRELKSKRGYRAELRDENGQIVDKLLVTIQDHGVTVQVGPIDNFRVVGDVELTKLGSTLTGGYSPLPGAQFLMKPINLTWDEDSGEVTNALVSTDRSTFRYEMSDANGKVVFENLAYGAYLIEENITPDGFEKNEPKPYAVVQVGLSADEFESLRAWMEDNYNDYDSVRFVYASEGMEWRNRAVHGSLSFEKRDGKGNNLSDALFALYMVDKNGVEQPVTLDKERNGVFTFAGLNGTATEINTDATGTGFIGQLPYGRYILVETKAPDNHRIVNARNEVFIYGANKEVNLVIENPEIEGTLRVIKKDADSEHVYLSGAEVSVYKRKADGTAGEYVGKAVTQIGGIGYLYGLKLGEYIAIETKAPEGYNLNIETSEKPFDITAENLDEIIELVFENTRKVYSLRILKVEEGEDGKLVPVEVAGAQFLVTHTASNGYWYPITNDKGVAELKDIPAGDYTILETMAPTGYIRDTTVRSITVDDEEEAVEISIVNERITGGVRIRKLDQDGEVLNSAKFELYKDGQTVPMKLRATAANAYVPDENGTVTEFTVGEATISGLEAGTYKLTETVVPEGYIKPDEARTFTVSATTHNELITVDIVNIKAEAAFAIRKVDADDSSLRLSGATFQLFKVNTLGVYEYVRSRTTDSTGYAVFTNLAPGSYRVDEVTPPTGYRLWSTPLYFEVTSDLKIAINNNEYTMVDGVVIATVVNYKSNQYFQVRKVDASTGSVLQNARFSLTGSGGNSSYYTVLTSGASGLTERVSLPAGTYYLQELAAPSGYQRTTATFTVVVDADGVLVNGTRLTGPSVFTYEMPNTPDSRTALLYKTDATSRAPLSGAVFSITQRGTGSAWTLSTNSSGRTGTFTLTPGYTYDIVETTTPSGYNRPMQGWTVSVSSSGTISVSGRGIVAYTDSGVVVINIDNTRTTTTTTTTTTPTPGTTTTPRATSTSTSLSTRSSSSSSSSSTTEEPIPLGPGLPRTGQYTNVGLLILGAVIMLISCAALMLYILKGRKEREGGYDVF